MKRTFTNILVMAIIAIAPSMMHAQEVNTSQSSLTRKELLKLMPGVWGDITDNTENSNIIFPVKIYRPDGSYVGIYEQYGYWYVWLEGKWSITNEGKLDELTVYRNTMPGNKGESIIAGIDMDNHHTMSLHWPKTRYASPLTEVCQRMDKADMPATYKWKETVKETPELKKATERMTGIWQYVSYPLGKYAVVPSQDVKMYFKDGTFINITSGKTLNLYVSQQGFWRMKTPGEIEEAILYRYGHMLPEPMIAPAPVTFEDDT